jgi:hypothetical protein
MILLSISLVLVAGVTYYHYLQGGFTAVISAICALIAMLLAFGYYEPVMGMFPPGRMADYSGGMLLVALYGFSYIVLRVIFDTMVPGNIRLPLWVDRGCAIGFGLIAAVLGVGTFLVAAQLLPFGPSIGMHANFPLVDRNVIIPRDASTNSRRDQDAFVFNQLEKNELPEGQGSTLTLDSIVLNIVSTASQGAFSGEVAFSQVHPDLLTVAFGNRLGADLGGKRTIINTPTVQQVTLDEKGLMTLNTSAIPAGDMEIKRFRPNEESLTLSKDSTHQLLVVRLRFEDQAADPDGYVRLTPAAAPMIVNGQIFYPIGAMTDAALALYRLDDQILISMKQQNRKVDLVYSLPNDLIAEHASTGTFAKGRAFLQIKLFGRVDLSGIPLNTPWSPAPDARIMIKKLSPLVSPTGKTNAQ